MQRRAVRGIFMVLLLLLLVAAIYLFEDKIVHHIRNSISISEHVFMSASSTDPSTITNSSRAKQNSSDQNNPLTIAPLTNERGLSPSKTINSSLNHLPRVLIPSEECNDLSSKREYITDVTKKRMHFVYIRVEKTGSSALRWLLYAFGINHKLNMMRSGIIQDFMSTEESEIGHHCKIGPRPNEPPDMVAEHAWYNEAFFKRHFPSDTVYLASVREPGSWLRSFVGFSGMFSGLKHDYHKVLADDKTFFKDAGHGIVKNLKMLLRNRQLQWFGFDVKRSDDIEYIKAYIEYIGSRFALILVHDHYDESMLMLRRTMNWSLKDIFTRTWNPTRATTPKDGYSNAEYSKLIDQRHNLGDWMLFQYSNQTLWEKISKSPCFSEELADFRRENKRVLQFCERKPKTSEELVIETRWEPTFSWTGDDCVRLLNELNPKKVLYLKQRMDDWSHIYARVKADTLH